MIYNLDMSLKETVFQFLKTTGNLKFLLHCSSILKSQVLINRFSDGLRLLLISQKIVCLHLKSLNLQEQACISSEEAYRPPDMSTKKI